MHSQIIENRTSKQMLPMATVFGQPKEGRMRPVSFLRYVSIPVREDKLIPAGITGTADATLNGGF